MKSFKLEDGMTANDHTPDWFRDLCRKETTAERQMYGKVMEYAKNYMETQTEPLDENTTWELSSYFRIALDELNGND